MAFYVVTHDLRKPDFDYQNLYAELANLSASRIQESVWVLCSIAKAADIFDVLWSHMHGSRDRLLVLEMSENWRSKNAITKVKPLYEECD